jgi:hypothetical protein
VGQLAFQSLKYLFPDERRYLMAKKSATLERQLRLVCLNKHTFIIRKKSNIQNGFAQPQRCLFEFCEKVEL